MTREESKTRLQELITDVVPSDGSLSDEANARAVGRDLVDALEEFVHGCSYEDGYLAGQDDCGVPGSSYIERERDALKTYVQRLEGRIRDIDRYDDGLKNDPVWLVTRAGLAEVERGPGGEQPEPEEPADPATLAGEEAKVRALFSMLAQVNFTSSSMGVDSDAMRRWMREILAVLDAPREEPLEDLWRRAVSLLRVDPWIEVIQAMAGGFTARPRNDIQLAGTGPTIRAALLALLEKLEAGDDDIPDPEKYEESLDSLWEQARKYGKVSVSEGHELTTASIKSTHVRGVNQQAALRALIEKMEEKTK